MKSLKTLLAFLILMQAAVVSANSYRNLLELIKADESYYAVRLTQAQKDEFIKGSKDIQTGAYNDYTSNDADKDYTGFLPTDLYDVYFKNVQSIFLAGYMSEDKIGLWKADYEALMAKDLDAELSLNDPNLTQAQKDARKQAYLLTEIETIHKNLLNRIDSSNVTCAAEGTIVKNRKCCDGHVKLQAKVESLPNVVSCRAEAQACTANSQCCSGMCNLEGADKPGVCERQVYCSRIRSKGEVCSNDHNICESSSCESNDAQNYTCMSCKKDGAKVTANEGCCPGYIVQNGKCKSPLPVYVPTVYNHSEPKPQKAKTSIIVKILKKIFWIESAQAAGDGLTDAQKQLLAEKTAECENNHAAGSEALTVCLQSVVALGESYKEDEYMPLTAEQDKEISAARETCTRQHETGTEGHATCMAKVDQLESQRLKENEEKGAPCAKNFEAGSEGYKNCMVDVGAMGIRVNKGNFLDQYEIPGVTAKTYSDIKSCEFNSMNDSWRDASNKERNAEVFLRAFEYVFSYQGTQDYWQDPQQGNIFSRANDVAQKFRENRSKLAQEMKEIDRKIACKCIAIFGPQKFSAVKQNFFNSSCEQEKAELQAQLGEDLNKGQESSQIDGTSISTLDNQTSEVDKLNAETEEVDKGAIGISHEKILVEWLQLRAEAQMVRFTDNSDLEETLQELSEHVSNLDYVEVYKDRIQSKNLVRSDPQGDSVLLYKWGYTYRPGWMKILNVLSLGLLEGSLLNSLLDFDKGRGNSSKAAVGHSMMGAWRYEQSDDLDSTPEIIDVKTMKKKCVKRKLGVCLKYADGFHRYFLGPNFSNESPTPATRCGVKARASSCFKTAYRVEDELFGEGGNYIMDPPRPLFVTASQLAVDHMPGYPGLTFTQMINDARNAGVNYLEGREPGGNIRGYRNGGDKFGNEDHLKSAIERGHFLPMGGELVIQSADGADSTIKNAIINGARRYARCKSLNKDCNVTVIADETILGLGYLFESDAEAQQFAEYTYHAHWVFPHITKANYMGYPLQDKAAYFSMLAYNMKLVGSLAASRSMQYAEAYNLYNSDFGDRVSEYNSLGEAAAGTRSRGLRYGEAFFNTFGQLNFNGETSLEQFDAALTSAGGASSFNSAELDALNAGRASAVRRNNDIKKAANLQKAIAKSDTTTKAAFAKNNAKFAKINNPLDSISIGKFGGGNSKALKGLANAINKVNKNIDSLKGKKGSRSSSGFNSVFKMPKIASYTPSPSSSSSNSNGVGPGNSSDTGMSKSEVNNLLSNLENDKDLERSDDDSLFGIVSKAYKRNYSRVLLRSDKIVAKPVIRQEKKIDSNKKEELKALLGN